MLPMHCESQSQLRYTTNKSRRYNFTIPQRTLLYLFQTQSLQNLISFKRWDDFLYRWAHTEVQETGATSNKSGIVWLCWPEDYLLPVTAAACSGEGDCNGKLWYTGATKNYVATLSNLKIFGRRVFLNGSGRNYLLGVSVYREDSWWGKGKQKNSQIINDDNCLLFLLLFIFANNPWKNWEPKAKVVFAYLNGCKVHSWEIGLHGGERCIPLR
jgi:hypothetical protein